jgi:hypothetical protein
MRDPAEGPFGVWSPDRPPMPSQVAAVASLAWRLLGGEPIGTAEDASVAITRLRIALGDEEVQRAVSDLPF